MQKIHAQILIFCTPKVYFKATFCAMDGEPLWVMGVARLHQHHAMSACMVCSVFCRIAVSASKQAGLLRGYKHRSLEHPDKDLQNAPSIHSTPA